MTARLSSRRASAQRGVALVVVLVLLLVATLLALASLRGTLLQARMGTSVVDRSLSFQAAEAALREGERIAAGRPEPAAGSGCVAGLCSKPDPDEPDDNERWLADGFWDDDSGKWREATVEVGDQTAKPRFIVELLDTGLPATGECTTSIDLSPDAGCFGTVNHYRMTAYFHAVGRADVMLQSVFAAP
jgi:type IV pilus assembly protein PilX